MYHKHNLPVLCGESEAHRLVGALATPQIAQSASGFFPA